MGVTWSVVRVNDDGRLRVVRQNLHPDTAMDIAGRLRDRQSDRDVGAGWNVLAFSAPDLARLQRKQKATSPVVQEAPRASETVWLGRMSADYSKIESR